MHLHQRYQKIHASVASFKLADVWVAPLREMAGKLRSTWLQVLKKSFQAYRANAVAHMVDYVFTGKVNLMINDSPLGKPFNLDTDAR